MFAGASRTSTRRLALPFLVFAVAGQSALAVPVSRVVHPGWALLALGLFAVTCVLAGATRRPSGRDLTVVAPLLFLAVLAVWRHADGGDVRGIEIVALLPVAWTALFGTLRQVVLTTAGYAATIVVPIWLVGAPDYPASGLRPAVITTVFAALIAPAARVLVRDFDRESARLDAVLRAATGHSVIATDLDGTITMFNPGAERMLGCRASDVLGSSIVQVLHDPVEIAERCRELHLPAGVGALTRPVTAAGAMETRDWTYVPRHGTRLTVSVTTSGIRNADAVLVGYVFVATDVTEARRAERTLASQQEVYRTLIDHLPMTTVGIFDEHLQCLTMGGHWILAQGLDPATMAGRHIGDFFSEADREQGIAIYRAGLEGPQLVEMPLATGHTYRFEVLPLVGPSGERWVLSVARDVSEARAVEQERERMTAALAVSEANFREAFDGAPIGIALTTVQGGQQERFLRVNAAFAGILGRSPQDLVGRAVAELTHPEDVQLEPELSADVATPRRLRKRFLHASGHPVWTEVSYAIVRDADGHPAHVIAHVQDIRAIKESERAMLEALERQRTATANLRQVDAMRREVVSTISHEIRTPLTSISGYLELLADEDLTAAQRQMIEVALRNSSRLSRLVDNLLVLARLDAAPSANAGNWSPVDIEAAVRAALDTVRPELNERGHRLLTEFCSPPPAVLGDAEQLHRVLINLLSNAVKYTPDDGMISVAIRCLRDRVRIEVADSGIGIPVEEQAHLFERFFRASTARDQAISGNGLGLAIVKSIVDLHQGTLSVSSTPGHGSCFTVELPLASAVRAMGPERFAPAAQAS